MDPQLGLLKNVAKALLQLFPGGGLVAELVIEAIPEAAQLIWDFCNPKTGTGPDPVRLTVLMAAVAQTPLHRLRAAVDEIVRELASDRTEAEQRLLATYLMHVQASVRRSLRRDSDPTGTTVPHGLVLRKAEDLVRFLPGRLPRLHPGFQPLADGDLELVELLGVGGFGEVWKARYRRRPQARAVALKFCLDAEAKRSLPREVELIDRVQAQGHHPGFVQLLQAQLEVDPPFLVYEYVEGGDLAGLIQEWHCSGKGPTPREAARVILRLARIVGHAHHLSPPIVHRDLKPANILVQPRGSGGQQFKITDFGIGAVVVQRTLRRDRKGVTSLSQRRSIGSLGAYTALYASPQQVRGDPPDPRDDVYALGVIWYQLLKGDLNAGRPGGRAWRKELSERGMTPGLTDVLDSCFEDEAANRPRDATVLADRLKESLHSSEEEVQDALPPDLLPPELSPPSKPRKVALKAGLLGGGALLMALVVGVASAWRSSSGGTSVETKRDKQDDVSEVQPKVSIPELLFGTWQDAGSLTVLTLDRDGTLSGSSFDKINGLMVCSGKCRMIDRTTMRWEFTSPRSLTERVTIERVDQNELVVFGETTGRARFTRQRTGWGPGH